MFRRLALTFGLVLVGNVAISPIAKANPVDVFFNGTVPASCTFSNKVDGTLKPNLAGTSLDSNPLITAGATPGSVRVSCNTNGTLRVDSPMKDQAPATYDDSLATKTASVTGLGGGLTLTTTGVTPATGALLPGDTNLTVNMSTGYSTNLPSGDYRFFVKLTATNP